MIDFYLTQCAEMAAQIGIKDTGKSGSKKAELAMMIHQLLDNDEMRSLCRTFREFWAMATRNSTIDDYLHHYYLQCANYLSTTIGPYAKCNPVKVQKIVSLLIPYFEGYTLTSAAVPLNSRQIAELLSHLIMQIIEE